MSRTPTSASLLAKPLYVFTLPPQLLDVLTVRSLPALGAAPGPDAAPEDNSNDISAELGPTGIGASLTCQTCNGIAFPSIDEQRAHFKSDWHRYNAKVALGGGAKSKGVLTAEEFEEINDGASSVAHVPIPA